MLLCRTGARACVLAGLLGLAGCYALPIAGPLVSDIDQEQWDHQLLFLFKNVSGRHQTETLPFQ